MEISWKIRTRLRIFAVAILLGIAVGVFVLLPINEFVYYTEFHEPGRPQSRLPVTNSARRCAGICHARPGSTRWWASC